jgi:hypothetical protein
MTASGPRAPRAPTVPPSVPSPASPTASPRTSLTVSVNHLRRALREAVSWGPRTVRR